MYLRPLNHVMCMLINLELYFFTLQVARKLVGHAHDTAVENKHGQVLLNMLQKAMALYTSNGLVTRYRDTRVTALELLYVDRDCCCTKLWLFSGGSDMLVRLDICHFIRCFAAGCTTESHQLHPFL